MANPARYWERFWMQFAGVSWSGRLACRLAAAFTRPYMRRFRLSRYGAFVDPQAVIDHDQLVREARTFIADRVVIYKAAGGGPVILKSRAHVMRDTVIETGEGGSVTIGEDTYVHPRGQVMAYLGSIEIGAHVSIAPNCAFYAYNHGFAAGELIKKQPLFTKGGIRIGSGAWLGFGVIVLDGVTIGADAVIGAGSLVTHDIPPGAIAAGSPARVLRYREAARQASD